MEKIDADIIADFSVLLIGIGTLGCVAWTPKFVWDGWKWDITGEHRERSILLLSVLTVGILTSIFSVGDRIGFWNLVLMVVVAVISISVAALVIWLTDHFFTPKVKLIICRIEDLFLTVGTVLIVILISIVWLAGPINVRRSREGAVVIPVDD